MPIFGCHDKFWNAEFQDLVRKRNSEKMKTGVGQQTKTKPSSLSIYEVS